MFRRTLSLSLFLAVSFGATGCSTGSSGAKPLPPPPPLRLALEDFAGFAAIRIEEAADNILQLNLSPEINRHTMFWRMRVIPMVRRTLILADEEAAMLGMWLMSRRMRHFVEEDPQGVEYFGTATPVALQACREIEEMIEGIATKALTPQEFEVADKRLTAYAKENPVSDRLDLEPGKADSWGAVLSSTLGRPFTMLETPLSHVSPTSGLSDAAVAAHRVAATVEQMATLAEYLPANARWQLDLLVLELEESKTSKTALQALHDIGKGSESIAATAAKLPAELGAEISKLIDDVDQKQTGLQTTLDKAHATVSEARATVEGLDKTLGQLDTVVQSTDPTAQSLTRMGASLTGAFEAFTKMIEVLFAPSPDPTPPVAEPGPPFDVNDYGRNAEKITATMKEVSAVLAQVEDLTQQDKFSALVGSADFAVQSTLDYFFVGTGLLVLFIFLVALGYRYLTRSMQRRRAA